MVHELYFNKPVIFKITIIQNYFDDKCQKEAFQMMETLFLS